jgi:hypothetical protein
MIEIAATIGIGGMTSWSEESNMSKMLAGK